MTKDLKCPNCNEKELRKYDFGISQNWKCENCGKVTQNPAE